MHADDIGVVSHVIGNGWKLCELVKPKELGVGWIAR